MRRRRSDGERGSGTVLMVGVVGVAITALTVLGLLIAVATARATAQTAADLGAISGATARYAPGSDESAACAAALIAVEESGASLSSCSLDGADVVVWVAVGTPMGIATATARAGPAP